MSIRSALVFVVLAGCYDEQSIEIAATRDTIARNLGVVVCAADGSACKPSRSASFVFSGNALGTEVHIVVGDDLDAVMLKLGNDGGVDKCGVIRIPSGVVHYDVAVTEFDVTWACELPACEPFTPCQL